MITDPEIRELFASPFFRKTYQECDHPTAPAALPDASLEFLAGLARQLGVASVFEFGSGRSTVALLEAGFSVTSLEDSSHWMEETRNQLSDTHKLRHQALVRPLCRRLHGLIPVMDWNIDSELAGRIREADLILIDSPYYTPFRESTLWTALVHNDHAIVVLDDTRIPTLRRFCDRLAATNPMLLHGRVKVGHTFDIFARLHDKTPLRRGHSAFDVLKGWRRFLMTPGLAGETSVEIGRECLKL